MIETVQIKAEQMFLVLTEHKLKIPVYINPEHISMVIRTIGSTRIVVMGGMVEVEETPEEIFGLERKEG